MSEVRILSPRPPREPPPGGSSIRSCPILSGVLESIECCRYATGIEGFCPSPGAIAASGMRPALLLVMCSSFASQCLGVCFDGTTKPGSWPGFCHNNSRRSRRRAAPESPRVKIRYALAEGARHWQIDNILCASSPAPTEPDEFALLGMDSATSHKLKPWCVAASPWVKCRSIETISLNSFSGKPTGRFLIFSTVVGVHIGKSAVENGKGGIVKLQSLAPRGNAGDRPAKRTVQRQVDKPMKGVTELDADPGRGCWRMYNTRRSDMTLTGSWNQPVVTSDQLADGEVVGQVPTVNCRICHRLHGDQERFETRRWHRSDARLRQGGRHGSLQSLRTTSASQRKSQVW